MPSAWSSRPRAAAVGRIIADLRLILQLFLSYCLFSSFSSHNFTLSLRTQPSSAPSTLLSPTLFLCLLVPLARVDSHICLSSMRAFLSSRSKSYGSTPSLNALEEQQQCECSRFAMLATCVRRLTLRQWKKRCAVRGNCSLVEPDSC